MKRALVWLGLCGALLVLLMLPGRWLPQRAQARPSAHRCSLPLKPATWSQRVQATADTSGLARAFKRWGYRVPSRGYLLGARIVAGVKQPAYQYVGLGQGGFQASPGRYWPASTIKLWAAVGALMRLHKRGLDGAAWLQFPDAVGRFAGQPSTLYQHMGNVDYDRLLRIATLQQLNHVFRVKLGYQHLILRRGYGGSGSMRRSPAIPFLQAAHRGSLPSSRFRPKGLRCRKNCTSLFEIQDVLRRVVLHNELPRSQRLPVASSDIKRLRASLRKQWKWIKDAVHRQLGPRAVIHSKAGSVPGNHLLDNAVITSPTGRFLLTVASPWPRRQTSVRPAQRRLSELARQGLWYLQQAAPNAPHAQADAGLAMKVALRRSSRRPLRFQWQIQHSPGKLTQLRAWQGTQVIKLTQPRPGLWRSRPLRRPRSGTILTLQGAHHGVPTSYRSLRVDSTRVRCR